jgi:KaiC/GvpD/RAD55 family RecA-like ATPase
MSLLQPEPTVKKDSTLERVKTGIVGLDNILQGGIPKYTTVLVSGQPGSGKTIFCYQFLYEGVKNKEKCLFLTLDKKVDGLLTQARELGIDFQPFIEEGLIKFLFLDINKKLIYETMTNEILSGGYNRIVLDSITPLSEMPIYINELALNRKDISIINPDDFSPDGNFPIRRLHLHYIMNVLENSKATCVVTSELPVGSNALSRDGISEFLADGVIVLTVDTTMDRRKMAVVKMRSTKHSLKPQEIDIVKGGIQFK